MKKTLLWLDDKRNPVDTLWKNTYQELNGEYEIVWVKKYHEFVLWITENGLPEIIFFDHDLNDIHIKKSTYIEMTGFDCAKWLVDYCLDNKVKLPRYGIQSSNTPGKENIDALFKSFIKHAE
jgi:hypothetical protein